jgi:hypothetical protein
MKGALTPTSRMLGTGYLYERLFPFAIGNGVVVALDALDSFSDQRKTVIPKNHLTSNSSTYGLRTTAILMTITYVFTSPTFLSFSMSILL